jgi:hypothetical protein
LTDKIGARFGLGIAFAIWQVGHILHGRARDLTHFIMARMVLGVGEAGGFPGGIKAVTEWFPKKERALAIGLFDAGNSIGRDRHAPAGARRQTSTQTLVLGPASVRRPTVPSTWPSLRPAGTPPSFTWSPSYGGLAPKLQSAPCFTPRLEPPRFGPWSRNTWRLSRP